MDIYIHGYIWICIYIFLSFSYTENMLSFSEPYFFHLLYPMKITPYQGMEFFVTTYFPATKHSILWIY